MNSAGWLTFSERLLAEATEAIHFKPTEPGERKSLARGIRTMRRVTKGSPLAAQGARRVMKSLIKGHGGTGSRYEAIRFKASSAADRKDVAHGIKKTRGMTKSKWLGGDARAAMHAMVKGAGGKGSRYEGTDEAIRIDPGKQSRKDKALDVRTTRQLARMRQLPVWSRGARKGMRDLLKKSGGTGKRYQDEAIRIDPGSKSRQVKAGDVKTLRKLSRKKSGWQSGARKGMSDLLKKSGGTGKRYEDIERMLDEATEAMGTHAIPPPSSGASSNFKLKLGKQKAKVHASPDKHYGDDAYAPTMRPGAH